MHVQPAVCLNVGGSPAAYGLFALHATDQVACLGDARVNSSDGVDAQCIWFRESSCSDVIEAVPKSVQVMRPIEKYDSEWLHSVRLRVRSRRKLAVSVNTKPAKCLEVPDKSGVGNMYSFFQLSALDHRLVFCLFNKKIDPNDPYGCVKYNDPGCLSTTIPKSDMVFQQFWPNSSPWTASAYKELQADTPVPTTTKATLRPTTTKPTTTPPTLRPSTPAPTPPPKTQPPVTSPPVTPPPSTPLPGTSPPPTPSPKTPLPMTPLPVTPPITSPPSPPPSITPIPSTETPGTQTPPTPSETMTPKTPDPDPSTTSAPTSTSTPTSSSIIKPNPTSTEPTAEPDEPLPTTRDPKPNSTTTINPSPTEATTTSTLIPTTNKTSTRSPSQIPSTTPKIEPQTSSMTFINVSNAWACCLSRSDSLFTPARIDPISLSEACLLNGNEAECRYFKTMEDCNTYLQAQPACLFEDSCQIRVRIVLPMSTTTNPPRVEAIPGDSPSSVGINTIIMWALVGLQLVIFTAVVLVYWRHHRDISEQDCAALYTDKVGLRCTPTHHSGKNQVMGRQLREPVSHPLLQPNECTEDDQIIGNRLDFGDLPMWRLDESYLLMRQVLSIGTQGIVAMGDYKGRTVAIKKLTSDRSTPAIQDFLDEIKVLSKLDCPYIVSMVGVCWERPRDVVLVMDFMPRGDLRTFLQRSRGGFHKNSFTWAQKVDCAGDICHGLVYLHSLDIVHRDLKSRNVLLNANMVAKLTDFGLSKEIVQDAVMSRGVGCFRWAAPEVLEGKEYSEAADIYSVGMILWELDTHEAPYTKQQRYHDWSDYTLYEHMRLQLISPEISPSCPVQIRQLISQCTQYDPSLRPSAIEMSNILDDTRMSRS